MSGLGITQDACAMWAPWRCRGYGRRSRLGRAALPGVGRGYRKCVAARGHGGACRRLPAALGGFLAVGLGLRRRVLAWPVGSRHPVGGGVAQTVNACPSHRRGRDRDPEHRAGRRGSETGCGAVGPRAALHPWRPGLGTRARVTWRPRPPGVPWKGRPGSTLGGREGTPVS